MTQFKSFPPISRWSRDIIITEKIDGTNASIYIGEDGEFLTGSRNRWITPDDDNFGFSKWAYLHKEELLTLGPGQHFGEWWGHGIQRGYGTDVKRFSLFNTSRWSDDSLARPACCSVVPVLYVGPIWDQAFRLVLSTLEQHGSVAFPGFMSPEGIVIFHTANGAQFKKTLKNDDVPKGSLK